MTEFDEQHLEVFLECYRDIRDTPGLAKKAEIAWVGRSAQDWLKSVRKSDEIEIQIPDSLLSEKPLNRVELKNKIARHRSNFSNPELLALVIEILAWGGQKPRNGRLALKSVQRWLPACREVFENPSIDAGHAYSKFSDLHDSGVMQGVGPAYYTKLIHFLGDGEGLIMDQWTARSSNLLSKYESIVKLDSRTTVSKRNKPGNYLKYIELVSNLCSILNLRFHEDLLIPNVESLIFSHSPDAKKKPTSLNVTEHRQTSEWRIYVKANT